MVRVFQGGKATSLPAQVIDGLAEVLSPKGDKEPDDEQSPPQKARLRMSVEEELAEIKHLIEELHHVKPNDGPMSPHFANKRRSRTSEA